MSQASQQGYEEIDLIELVIKIYKFFKRRYKLMLITVMIAVLLGWIASSLLILPRYFSSMIISSRSLSASEVSGLISTLDELVKDYNVKEFTKLTKIPEKDFGTIVAIKAMPNRDFQKYVEKDVRKDSTVAISIDLTNNAQWEIIQNGIVYYLENIPYVQKRTKIYREGQEKLLQQVQKEIKNIDSLKKIIEASPNAKNTIILSNSGGIYNEAFKLHETEKNIKENIALSNDIHVIKDFAHLQQPKKASVKETILIFGGVGFILGFLLALILELNRIIRKRENKI
ncbi:MAG: hypothetical protein MUC49_18115 [Raineya sp.]|jgi:hypothetical protein|nr:hypothetical protein [Raineya sp.]